MTDGHLSRWYIKPVAGDAANVILGTIGHNLRLVLGWLRLFAPTTDRARSPLHHPDSAQSGVLTAN